MRSHRFRMKLLLEALLPSVLLAVLLSYLWLTWSQRSLENALQQRIEALAGELATGAEFHLFTGDGSALLALTGKTLERHDDLVAVSIIDGQGKVLMASRRSGPIGQGSVTPLWPEKNEANLSRLVKPIIKSPLVLDDPFSNAAVATNASDEASLLGQVALEVSLENLYRERNRQLALGLAAILLALVAAGALALYLANGVTRPISRIMSVVERIGQGDKSARVEPDPDCVLFQLEIGINRMAEKVAITQEDMQARIDAATDELVVQKELAEEQARIDSLTGLHNRRALMERAALEWHRAERHGLRFCLIILDLDYFKHINDEHGHAAGDRVLIDLARVLRQSIREIDFVARLGGEEFVILMPDTDAEEARLAAERMRMRIAAMRVPVADGAIACTASFGLAEYSGDDADVAALVTRADQALYLAKASGRDQVCVFGVESTVAKA